MTLTIELTAEQEARLADAARKERLEPTVLASKWIEEHLPPVQAQVTPDSENQAVIDLLRSWREEDATDDEEELERRDIENEALMSNLQANRLTLRVPQVNGRPAEREASGREEAASGEYRGHGAGAG